MEHISNFEVLEKLQEYASEREHRSGSSKSESNRNLNYILKNSIEYLKSTPSSSEDQAKYSKFCFLFPMMSKDWNCGIVSFFFLIFSPRMIKYANLFEKYGVTITEAMQLMNFIPTKEVELYLVEIFGVVLLHRLKFFSVN